MDTYHHVLSVIKKLGYICDTSLYISDYQYGLFLRRLNDTDSLSHFCDIHVTRLNLRQNATYLYLLVLIHT